MSPPSRFPFSLLPLLSGFRQFLFFLCFLFPPSVFSSASASVFAPRSRLLPFPAIIRHFPRPLPVPISISCFAVILQSPCFPLSPSQFPFSLPDFPVFPFPFLSVPPFRFQSSCFPVPVSYHFLPLPFPAPASVPAASSSPFPPPSPAPVSAAPPPPKANLSKSLYPFGEDKEKCPNLLKSFTKTFCISKVYKNIIHLARTGVESLSFGL